jgi:hypothetical protein
MTWLFFTEAGVEAHYRYQRSRAMYGAPNRQEAGTRVRAAGAVAAASGAVPSGRPAFFHHQVVEASDRLFPWKFHPDILPECPKIPLQCYL